MSDNSTNNPLSSSCDYNLVITDVNDNSPVFVDPGVISVKEDVDRGLCTYWFFSLLYHDIRISTHYLLPISLFISIVKLGLNGKNKFIFERRRRYLSLLFKYSTSYPL